MAKFHSLAISVTALLTFMVLFGSASPPPSTSFFEFTLLNSSKFQFGMGQPFQTADGQAATLFLSHGVPLGEGSGVTVAAVSATHVSYIDGLLGGRCVLTSCENDGVTLYGNSSGTKPPFNSYWNATFFAGMIGEQLASFRCVYVSASSDAK